MRHARWFLALAGVLLVAVMIGCGGSAVTQAQERGDVQSLIAALQSEDWNTRADAAEALGALGDPQAVPALAQALADESASVRVSAVEALGKLGDPRAVEPLVALLERSDPAIGDFEREAAAKLLGKLGDQRAVTALARYATENYEVAKAALVAIGKPAVKPLIDALKLKNATRRQVAAEALGKIGDPRAVKPLLAYGARGFDEDDVAASALVDIGKPAVDPLIAGLDKALAGDDTWGATTTVIALGKIGDRRAVPVLQRAMGPDVIVTVWNEASDALAHMYRKDLPKLLAMLKSQDTVQIYWGLIGLGKNSTVDELVAALSSYGDESMGEDYLNCGNSKLEQAARDWAYSHGYTITTLPGFGGDPWGSKG